MRPSIIFDFDGTLAVGHEPVLAYARAVAENAGAHFVERVETELESFDAGAARYRDGYHIVADLAEQDGVPAGAIAAAYTASRERLGTAEAPVHAQTGLAELLFQLHEHATLILATNAPPTGVNRVLQAWGVDGLFDAVHVNVGKPEGLQPIVAAARENGPVLAIGDIVSYDLQPAIDLGVDTALVGATSSRTTAPVTFTAPTLMDLRDDIIFWAVSTGTRDTTTHTD